MSTGAVLLNDTGNAAYQLLKLTAVSADAFPPLKGAAGGVLYIVDLVKVRFLAPRSRLICADFRFPEFSCTEGGMEEVLQLRAEGYRLRHGRPRA